MTGHTQLAVTPRDRFLQAAERELIAFERREREFLKRDREERVARLEEFPGSDRGSQLAKRAASVGGRFRGGLRSAPI